MIRNQSGLSLIETAIASSVGIVIMLALGELMMSQQRATRDILQTYEVSAAFAQATELLSDSQACTNNFMNRDPNIGDVGNSGAPPLTRLLDRIGAPLTPFVEGNVFGMNQVTLIDIDRMPVAPASVPNSRGNFILRLTFRPNNFTLGQRDVSMDLPVFFRTNALNRIQSCSTQGVSGSFNCVYPSLSCAGCTMQRVSCPAGFRVTGGGINDQDTSKNAFYSHPIAPGTAGFPNGGWHCENGDGGFQICSAVCCQ